MSVLLVFIFLISGFFRTSHLAVSPPELFGDEIDIGYQAFSLLKTGRDLYNQPLPTYIHSLSEYRAPLMIYMTVPSIAALGNTPLAVRLPEVLFGLVAPWLIVCLAYQLTRSKTISLVSGIALALMPWHIHYSRAAFEVVILLDLIIAGVVLLLKRQHVLGAFLLGISLYCYSTAVLFVPLLFLSLWLLVKSTRSYKSLLCFVLVVAPLFYQAAFGQAGSRFSLLSIWNDSSLEKNMLENRQTVNSATSRLWFNKYQLVEKKFIENYLQAFSSDFLFVRGDPTLRHGIGYAGVLLPISAVFLILGLVYLLVHKKWFILSWLLLAPIPAAFTSDGGYHATRLFLLIPPLAITIGSGWLYLITHLSFNRQVKLLVLGPILLLGLYQFGWYWNYYTTIYPKVSWRWWHVGFSQSMTNLSTLQSSYSRVVINNTYEPSLIRYLFYTSYNPAKFHTLFTLDQPKKDIFPGYDGFTLDNRIFFGSFSPSKTDLSHRLLPNTLYMLSQRDDIGDLSDWRTSPPADIKVLDTITNPFDQPIFYLVTKK